MDYDIATVNGIIAKLQTKVKRQRTAVETTTMELEHWRQIRAKLEKEGKK